MVMRRHLPVFPTLTVLIAVSALNLARGQDQNVRPVADAGSSRYAGTDPVHLDGTGSYDPDGSDPLIYAWQQIDGPPVIVLNANTPTPTIAGSMTRTSSRDPTLNPAGFAQTNAIQECTFELTVSDGELTSEPDTVKVVIVPAFGQNSLALGNAQFDPDKPTIIYFGGGDCTYGQVQYSASPLTDPNWLDRANLLTFPKGYGPDTGSPGTYYRCGDMILTYLSAVAPDYRQPIQTCGWSTGGQPAIDVRRYLNLTYKDRRYAINRVTFFDTTPYCRDYSDSVHAYLGSSVDGEQCWVDNYVSSSGYGPATYPFFYDNVLNFWFETGTGVATTSTEWWQKHRHAQEWYNNSLSKSNMNSFSSGIVAGAYWSVIGPGKNLQLAWTPNAQTYKFQWYEWNPSGYLDCYPGHLARLPEPVVLVGPPDGAFVDPNGARFSCEESENAAGYQLLFGSDPDRIMDYLVISDTPTPPAAIVREFPSERTWWTIKAYDEFGSTIHADPRCINAEVVSPPMTLPQVLYIHKYDIEAAHSVQSLLVDYGCRVTLIGLTDVPTALMDSYDLIIVADDTQYMSTWDDPQTVAAIETSGKPVLGLGEGGYDFFGVLGLSIGRPHGMHGEDNSLYAIDPNSPLFGTPYPIDIPEDRIVRLYTESNSVTVSLTPVPENVLALGGAVGQPGYLTVALEHDRYVLWGFTESPAKMTEDGERLFINAVVGTANRIWRR